FPALPEVLPGAGVEDAPGSGVSGKGPQVAARVGRRAPWRDLGREGRAVVRRAPDPRAGRRRPEAARAIHPPGDRPVIYDIPAVAALARYPTSPDRPNSSLEPVVPKRPAAVASSGVRADVLVLEQP